jgi:hypothetical protein
MNISEIRVQISITCLHYLASYSESDYLLSFVVHPALHTKMPLHLRYYSFFLNKHPLRTLFRSSSFSNNFPRIISKIRVGNVESICCLVTSPFWILLWTTTPYPAMFFYRKFFKCDTICSLWSSVHGN